jgi:hypothetical protein
MRGRRFMQVDLFCWQLIKRKEPDEAGLSARRRKPTGDEGWVESMARKFNLESVTEATQEYNSQKKNPTKRPDPFVF